MSQLFARNAIAGALDGVTVIDLTRYLPGPYCTRLLADLGAAVVKVEGPGGDPMRTIAWYDRLNHGKRVVTIDLRDEAGRRELHALLATADVCVEAFKPATARRFGVDGATLSARYPRLVHCAISGYGQSGPDADRAGHDLNYQAEAGLLSGGGAPRMPRLLLADITGGLHAALSIFAALVARGRTGSGAALDMPLHAAAQAWTPFLDPPTLSGEHACYNIYATADGEWVALGALEAKFWERFCRHAGREDWIPLQFAPDPARSELLRAVRALFASRPAADWTRELTPLDCCFSLLASPRTTGTKL